MKHPHAELMLQYAQDAMTTSEPWELWEFKHPHYDWVAMERDMPFLVAYQYRHKSQTVTKWLWADHNGYLYQEFLTEEEASVYSYPIKLEWSATEFEVQS